MTPHQHKIVEALTQRILPGEYGPGAQAANVMGFFDWAVSKRFFRAYRASIETGLDFIESLARRRYTNGFAECSPSQQDSLLRELESISHPAAQHFLEIVIDTTLAGFLCDPRYGGNRETIGWRFTAFDPIAQERSLHANGRD